MASNVPNDGSQDITVPSLGTNSGRIKIVCTGGSNIFFDINDMDIAIVSGCAAEGGTIANDANVIASPGDATLDLNLCAGIAMNSWSNNLAAGDPTMTLTFKDTETNQCANPFSNAPVYESLTFCTGQNGSVTFSRSGSLFFSNVFNLYSETFTSSSPCTDWLNSSALLMPSAGTFSTESSMSENLTAGTQYEFVCSAFNGTAPSAGTGDFTVAFSSTLFETSSVTPVGYLYTYVIVNSSNVIVAFDPDADLSNASAFTGGDFTVHGLSYLASVNLNASIGSSFATFQTQLNSGAICGDLSTNSVSVEILGPTPIELLSFDGRLQNKSVLLEWQTQTEINNDYFLIEKSTNGRDFEKLGTVQGAGDSEAILSYELIDPSPAVGFNYYRLTQFDFDGTSTVVDKIVAVEYKGKDIILLQPNPVKGDQIQLIYSAQSRGDLAVEIYSITGQLLKTLSLNVEADRNVFDISLDEMSSGVYILKTQQQESVNSLRFVKTE